MLESVRTLGTLSLVTYVPSCILVCVHMARKTQLLVSRLLPAKRECVIIHYFIISYDVMNTCTNVTSFNQVMPKQAQQMMQDQQ